jgi:hypothetical protein
VLSDFGVMTVFSEQSAALPCEALYQISVCTQYFLISQPHGSGASICGGYIFVFITSSSAEAAALDQGYIFAFITLIHRQRCFPISSCRFRFWQLDPDTCLPRHAPP